MPDSFFLKGLIVALVFGVPAGTIGALTIQYRQQVNTTRIKQQISNGLLLF